MTEVTPVTRNNEETRLAELEHRLYVLVTRRKAAVEAGRVIIERANRQFDRDAVPVRREIDQLRAALRPPAPKHKPRKRVVLTGLTPEEQEHYRRLLDGKNA